MCVASQNPERGELPSLEHVAFHLKLSPGETADILATLIDAGLIDKVQGSKKLRMHSWEKRQRDSDNAGLMKSRYRKKDCLETSPETGPKTVRPSRDRAQIFSSDTETDTETEGENPPPLFSRSPEDQSQFDEAVSLLRGSTQTQDVAVELCRRADLSEIRAIEGWKWLNAARVMGKGAKAYTVEFLLGIARGTTREEFEANGRAPRPGGKFAPGDTGARAPDSSDRPWEDPKYVAQSEETRRKLAEIKAGKETNGQL